MITLTGHCGLEFKVYQTATGTWAWVGQDGCGFTNADLLYILDYLAETKGVKLDS
jgi:hypothetical protein